jgi:hypothetical protein
MAILPGADLRHLHRQMPSGWQASTTGRENQGFPGGQNALIDSPEE